MNQENRSYPMDLQNIHVEDNHTEDNENVQYQDQQQTKNQNIENENYQPLQNYIISKTLGKGNFGKVKLATHKLTNQLVAVKILQKELIFEKSDIVRISRQLKIMKLIRHPFVIQLYQIIQTPKQLYLIMEYAEKGDLFDKIVKLQRFQEGLAAQFYSQIALGLQYLHDMGVTHRDLKPQNILIDKNNTVKIADFGLGNMFKTGEKLKTACGSPCYAAPQMLNKQEYDPRKIDIWSSGIILYAMVCGYLPFQDKVTSKLYDKIKTSNYKLPSWVSNSCRNLIRGILTKDPSLRWDIQVILEHDFLNNQVKRLKETVQKKQINEKKLNQICQKYGILQQDRLINSLRKNKHSNLTTLYYLGLKSLQKQQNPFRKNTLVSQFQQILDPQQEQNKQIKQNLKQQTANLNIQSFNQQNSVLPTKNQNQQSEIQQKNKIIHQQHIQNNEYEELKMNEEQNNQHKYQHQKQTIKKQTQNDRISYQKIEQDSQKIKQESIIQQNSPKIEQETNEPKQSIILHDMNQQNCEKNKGLMDKNANNQKQILDSNKRNQLQCQLEIQKQFIDQNHSNNQIQKNIKQLKKSRQQIPQQKLVQQSQNDLDLSPQIQQTSPLQQIQTQKIKNIQQDQIHRQKQHQQQHQQQHYHQNQHQHQLQQQHQNWQQQQHQHQNLFVQFKEKKFSNIQTQMQTIKNKQFQINQNKNNKQQERIKKQIIKPKVIKEKVTKQNTKFSQKQQLKNLTTEQKQTQKRVIIKSSKQLQKIQQKQSPLNKRLKKSERIKEYKPQSHVQDLTNIKLYERSHSKDRPLALKSKIHQKFESLKSINNEKAANKSNKLLNDNQISISPSSTSKYKRQQNQLFRKRSQLSNISQSDVTKKLMITGKQLQIQPNLINPQRLILCNYQKLCKILDTNGFIGKFEYYNYQDQYVYLAKSNLKLTTKAIQKGKKTTLQKIINQINSQEIS